MAVLLEMFIVANCRRRPSPRTTRRTASPRAAAGRARRSGGPPHQSAKNCRWVNGALDFRAKTRPPFIGILGPPTRFWLPSRSASVSAKYASGSISSEETHMSVSIYITLSMDGSSNKARKASSSRRSTCSRCRSCLYISPTARRPARSALRAGARRSRCRTGAASVATIRRLVQEGLPVAPLLQVLGRVNKHQDRRLVGVDGTAVVHATQLRLRRVPSIIRQVGRRGRRDRRYTLTVGGGPVRLAAAWALAALSRHTSCVTLTVVAAVLAAQARIKRSRADGVLLEKPIALGFFRRGGANSSAKACCAVEARLERVLRRLVEQSGRFSAAAPKKRS